MTRLATRCAIYTRKSSDEGLDQDFNSLDAQHEACAAYIASQRHEGWKLSKGRYDDGGVSGGTLERPALQRLVAEIHAGRIDMVVVYKIDRLTRSLADFAKLVDRFEASGCSFVSVTQAFNTSSSMGRLTLNVLLSFAQFEREVTAERIRDKIAASKKKGLWMGGLAPLGYNPHPDRSRRELIVNEAEAVTVRRMFELYLEHGCLNATAAATDAEGIRSKHRVFASGRVQCGTALSRGQIHKVLTNPVYRGLIRHKEKTWPGLHPAIIEETLWDAVQEKLCASSARRRGTGSRTASPKTVSQTAPLMGKIRDETGDLLTPTHTERHGRRFRYYVSNRLVNGTRDPRGWRVPANTFEQTVGSAIAGHLDEWARRHRLLRGATVAASAEASETLRDLVRRSQDGSIGSCLSLLDTGIVSPGHIAMTLNRDSLAATLGCEPADLHPHLVNVDAPLTCKRRGVEMKIVAGDLAPEPDPTLVGALRKAHQWADMLKGGTSLTDIARAEGYSESYVRRLTPLATLSPRAQNAIVTGTQPIALTLETLVRGRLPLRFEDQERLAGFRN